MTSKKSIIAAGIIGNVIEYYDFALIGFLAVMMGKLFFPSEDPFLSLLGSFGAFAAGMIMRPLGALVFGHIGDRVGRRFALITSLVMMALPTFLIGFLPTYAHVGIIAPILLVLLRMIQGLSVGGEYASSIVYLVEQSTPQHRNLYGSFVSVGAKIGMALGSGLCGALLWYLGADAMGEWGWRIPFWVSIVIALLGLYLRRNLTENYTIPHDTQVPIVQIITHHRREVGQFFGIAAPIWVFYYTIFVYLPIWLEKYAHLSKGEAGQINTLSILIGVVFIPLMAMVADKIGSVRVMKYAAFALIFTAYPLFYEMSVGGYWGALWGAIGLVVLLSAFQSPIFAMTVMALPHHGVRASFTALILGTASGIVGGLTPSILTTIDHYSGDPLAPAYLIILGAVGGWAILRKIRL
jgi:MHS family proline/betaine transporter-like MFS transporter